MNRREFCLSTAVLLLVSGSIIENISKPTSAHFVADLDAIRSEIDIVDLIRRYVVLEGIGSIRTGRCPFHVGASPSLVVYRTKGIFHCFGCGVGGDVFGFLMRQDRLTFAEAFERLRSEVA